MFTLPTYVFTYLDVALVLFLLLGLINGFRRGLLLSLIDLIGLILALWLSFRFAPTLAEMIPLMRASEVVSQFPLLGLLLLQQINTIMWFFILFAAISLILLLIKPMFKAINKVPIVGGVNQILGALLGALKTLFMLWLLSLLLYTPLFNNGKALVEASYLRFYRELPIVLPIETEFDYAIFIKLIKNERLDQSESESLEAYMDDLFKQEALQAYLNGLLESGQLGDLELKDIQAWLSQFDALDAIESWWESVRP